MNDLLTSFLFFFSFLTMCAYVCVSFVIWHNMYLICTPGSTYNNIKNVWLLSWFYLFFSSVSAFTCCVPFPPPISHIRFFLRSGNNTYPPRTVWYPLEYRTAIRCPGCVCTNPRPCQGTARDRFTDGVPSAAASYRSQLDGLRLCCGLPRPGGQSRRQQRWPPGLVPLRDRDDAA